MLLYVLKLNQNAKMPEAYGKYYAYPVITQTVGIDGLAEHMASHNTPFSKGSHQGHDYRYGIVRQGTHLARFRCKD